MGQEDIPAGEKKVQEYAERIRAGASKEEIFEGLPDTFKTGIERQLLEPTGDMQRDNLDEVRRGDEEKREEVLARLGVQTTGTNFHTTPSTEERKKLAGWSASYELARIAKEEGTDLTSLSREEYAEYAVRHALAIDDAQLRVSPWQRMAMSPQEIIAKNKEMRATIDPKVEKDFARFSYDMLEKAATEDRSLGEGIRIRQGTKDSNSWLFFGINEGAGNTGEETHKSYVSLKDLNSLTPARFTSFMEHLRSTGYNGDIKIFQDLSDQGLRLNDQIVMHGASEEDAALGLQAAEQFFGNDLDQKSLGTDGTLNGEKKSYSQLLAARIASAIKNETAL